jgi:prepilin-type N-terminal cleavage/methylation domain-containing protein
MPEAGEIWLACGQGPVQLEHMRKTLRAFTLIELLVVIAIIGILASMLFPAVNGAIDAARKAQAKNDVVQIATAVTAFETEYGRLPLTNKTVVDTALVNVLIGNDTAENPRKITFIEPGTRKPDIVGRGGKSGTNASGYVDPWGAPYNIAMSYDNTIPSAGADPGPTANNLRKRVAVWNVANGKDNNEKKRRSVVSWE